MQNSLVETLVGAIVLAVAAGFLFFAYSRAEVTAPGGYSLAARFDRVDGITAGSDVRIAGIKVGSVTRLTLDPNNYLARLEMTIDKEVQVPDDSQIKVASSGLLGDSYLSIEVGGNDSFLAEGSEFENTQGAIDLMSLISKAIFSLGGSSDKEKTAPESGIDSPEIETGAE